MMRLGLSLLVTAGVLVAGSLAGCGSSQASSAGSSVSSGTISRPTTAPTITGVPATTAVAGHAYSFQPQATNTGGAAVSFTIANPPAWAKFNTTTGQLTGTPTTSQVGRYAGIAITLVAGTTKVAMPAFAITVAPSSGASGAPGAVTLSWDAPTENSNGTPLTDLKGYVVHYGSASQTYSDTIEVSNPGLTTYVVQNLPAGYYYFAVSAYNAAGTQSGLSPEVATQVD
jgi:Putative Ig domain/Fibronectin type III domain